MDFNKKNREARAGLEAKYKNQFTPQIKQLLATNQLSILFGSEKFQERVGTFDACLLYTSDAADERSSVDLGGRRIIKKKNKEEYAGGERIQKRQNR